MAAVMYEKWNNYRNEYAIPGEFVHVKKLTSLQLVLACQWYRIEKDP
jgi:hypothetical protein